MGKSTLCKQLAKLTEGKVIHFGLLPDTWDWFWDYEKRASLRVVWDRGWVSELAYQQVTGRAPRLDGEHVEMVKTLLRMHACVNVTVTCNAALLAQRLNEEADDKFSKAVVVGVNRWFMNNHLYHGTDVLIHCDGRKPYPSEADIKRIMAFHNKRASMVLNTIGEDLTLSRRLAMATA